MKILLCPSCNKPACSLVVKMTFLRLFPIVCRNCGVGLCSTSYLRSIIDFLAFFMIPVIAIWGAGKWDSWVPAIVYIGLVFFIHYVWKALSPLKERST